MNELFDIPESKSPRLKWIEENGILTAKDNMGAWHAVSPREDDDTSRVISLMMQYKGSMRHAKGQTEDDAITNLAKAIGLRLWTERGIA
jgi:rRNA maturation endonuclease Nob1